MFNERIIELVNSIDRCVIVCLETAADMQLLSSGVVYVDSIRVFSTEPLTASHVDVEVVPESVFASKEVVTVDGVLCTAPVQTVIDLLEYESDVDIQTLVEALSDYYYSHSCSFEELEAVLSEKQSAALDKWRQDALDCHSEG